MTNSELSISDRLALLGYYGHQHYDRTSSTGKHEVLGRFDAFEATEQFLSADGVFA